MKYESTCYDIILWTPLLSLVGRDGMKVVYEIKGGREGYWVKKMKGGKCCMMKTVKKISQFVWWKLGRKYVICMMITVKKISWYGSDGMERGLNFIYLGPNFHSIPPSSLSPTNSLRNLCSYSVASVYW